jgi:hypothetical protein
MLEHDPIAPTILPKNKCYICGEQLSARLNISAVSSNILSKHSDFDNKELLRRLG